MEQFPFQKFIDLVTLDQQAHQQLREIQTSEQEVQQLQQARQTLTQQLQMIKNQRTAARKEVDAKEFEIKSLDEAEKTTQHKIDTLQNPKEYWALKKEIEHLKTKQHNFEQDLLAAWHAAEIAERELKTKQAIYDTKVQELQLSMDTKRKTIEERKTTIKTLTEQRQEKMQGIPEEWLEKYARMQTRIANPVVPVINDSCSACFYKVSAQDLISLRRRALLQCKQCYRFLYLESAMREQSVDEATKPTS